MRGKSAPQTSMLFLKSPSEMIPKDHPLRRVKQYADASLRGLSDVFDAMYAEGGRQSVPPERLLKASLLMALYTVRSERMFCEQLGYNMLFRRFANPVCRSPRRMRLQPGANEQAAGGLSDAPTTTTLAGAGATMNEPVSTATFQQPARAT